MGTSKGHGKYIETPEFMWELFELYRKNVKENPRNKKIKGNKEYVIHNENLEVPLTMVGFENFVFESGYNAELKDYFSNRDDKYSDYSPICSRIRGFIRQDQIEGGMVGQYNPSITQRLNNLTEKQETKQDGTINIKFGDID